MGKDKLKHIELFAGCGGMSLGLDAAGFELYFANELSPMAGETFAYNILDENLREKAEVKKGATKVNWITSKFPKESLTERLRENPFEARNGNYSDIKSLKDLKNKLLIGDIDQLLAFLNKNRPIVDSIREEGIDLLSGGPPCQSFSLAGKRVRNDQKNLLPLSFAKITGLLRPKVVLLENVKGITAPFTEIEVDPKTGKETKVKYYAWLEVSKAFALEGYVPVCMMLNSKYFGVAQNRPRFILYAFRKDIFDRLYEKKAGNKILRTSLSFYDNVILNENHLERVTIQDFKYYNLETEDTLFDGILLPKAEPDPAKFISAIEAIGDIRRTETKYFVSKITNRYGFLLNRTFKYKDSNSNIEIKNHDVRVHNFDVKSRFRFYQVINEFQNGMRKSAVDLFTGKDVSPEDLINLFKEFEKYDLLFKDDRGEYYKKPKAIEEVDKLVKAIPTKKHSQRALLEFEPAPAQLTIPDDLCHYHMETLRTMTVREMARFQSFPDWFEFRSKVTTGGKSRKFEVPQYTQVGNAVPPLLAKSLGDTIYNLLNSLCQNTAE